MRKTWLVLRREYVQAIRSKLFWIGTLGMPALMLAFVGLSVGAQLVDPERQKSLIVLDETARIGAAAAERLREHELSDGRPEFLVEVQAVDDATSSRKEDEAAIVSGEIYGVVTIDRDLESDSPFRLYRKSVGDESSAGTVRRALRDATIAWRLENRRLELSRDELDALMAPVGLETYEVTQGETRQKQFEEALLATFAFVLILFITLYLYGFSVTRGIIQDKTNRVMEVLLGSVSPDQLITGKILGVGLVGLTQIAIYTTVGIGVRAAAGMLPTSELRLDDALSIPKLLAFVLFFMLGYFLFSSLFAIVGAVCNTEQDAQHLQFPVMVCLMIPYVLTFFFVQHPDSTAATVISMIPLFTPMVMFMRISVLTPPAWQIALSVLFTLIAIVIMFRVAARIFRIGTLMYGKRPGLREILRWARA